MNRRTTVTLTIEGEGEGGDETEVERVFEIESIGNSGESWVLLDGDDTPRLVLTPEEFQEIGKSMGEL